jgi:hypothetical protein
MTGLYGNADMAQDENFVLLILKALIDIQVTASDIQVTDTRDGIQVTVWRASPQSPIASIIIISFLHIIGAVASRQCEGVEGNSLPLKL